MFAYAEKHQPCIIFFDELDAFTQESSNDRSSSTADVRTLLQIVWSRLANERIRVLVIGATNKPDQVKDACLRRLGIRVHIRLPNEHMRIRLLQWALKPHAYQLTAQQLGELARSMGQLSGSDIHQAVKRAVRKAQRAMTKSSYFVNVRLLPPLRASDQC